MKGIFTYPNNPSTHYINPDYVGDATSGFQRRIQELIDGDYANWFGIAPADDVDAVMTGMGKYNRAFQETSGENTRFQFWVQPMVEFVMRAKAQHIKDISIDNHSFTDTGNDYNFLKLKVEFDDAHSFSDGQRLYIFTPTTPELGDVTVWYAEPIDSTHIYLRNQEVKATNPPNHNQYLFPQLENGLYDNRHHGNNTSRAHRYQDGSVIRFDTVPPFYDNANIQLVSYFSEPSDSGTLNQLSTPFYLQRRGGSSWSYEVFTDAAKTTRATLNEHYYDSVTKNYTTAGTFQLNDQLFSDWGITNTAAYSSDSNGWCRIIATVTTGTFTGNSSSDETIPTSISYAEEFYWDHFYDGDHKFTIYNKRSQEGTSIVQDFILADAGSGVNVDIEIKFINPARTPGGWGFYLLDNTYDEDASFSTDPTPRFEVNRANILLPGVQQHRYQDANNVTQNGAKYYQQWYEGMGTPFPLDTDESFPADSTIQLDSNGRLAGFNFPAGTSDDRGNFDISTTRLMKITNADNLYVAPTQTVAEQQDNWNTADYWLNNNFNASKEWPKTVRPRSADWTIQQPSTQTVSQNGVRYIRKSGRVLYRFEVEYPPMTYDQFKDYWSLVQAANGPATTFKFPLNYDGGYRVLFPANPNVPSIVRLLETTNTGESVFTLEGFPTNQTDAIRNGELILLGGDSSINGGIVTSITEQDANAYGEVKFRVSHPLNSAAYGTNLVYPNPDHIHVTLDTNDTVYTVDTAGFYYLTVAFMADYYK